MAAQSATVKNVRVWHSDDYTRMVLDLDAPVQHNVVLANNPTRLILDLANTKLKAPLPALSLAGTPIEIVRSSVVNKKDLRLVLDLKQKVSPKSFFIKKSGDSDDRLVVDLYDVEIPSTTKSTGTKSVSEAVATNKNNSVRPADAATKNVAPSEKEPVDFETSGGASDTKSPASDAHKQRPILIVVDAGHGGEDTGALGPNHLREKDITLAITKELVKIINDEPGYTARYTRSTDIYLELKKRRDIGRSLKADLFISIHADAFTDTSARGASVFALSRNGATSETARFLAQRENDADLIGGAGAISLDDKDVVLAGVLVDLSMTATVNSSLQLGALVLKSLGAMTVLHANHVEQAGFLVLKSPDVPSILVETGFISSPEESRKLANPEHRTKIAQAIFKGVKQYFLQHPVASVATEKPVEKKKSKP